MEVTGSVGNAGGIVVYGRSDTTLKPGGVRIGTAEVYRFAEEVPAVEDSLVIGDQIKVGKRAGDVRIVLFVKLTPVRRRAPLRRPAVARPPSLASAHRRRHPRGPPPRSPRPPPQGTELTKELEEEIRAQIRNGASDAHVPALIKEVQKIPYTRSGKKVELAVRALFEGQEPKNVGALQDDTAFDEYRKMAADGF